MQAALEFYAKATIVEYEANELGEIESEIPTGKRAREALNS
jgi:hypothetical protein